MTVKSFTVHLDLSNDFKWDDLKAYIEETLQEWHSTGDANGKNYLIWDSIISVQANRLKMGKLK